jgi:hypothetical protein
MKTDREILSIVDQEFTSAMGAPDGEISSERALALDYYNSKPLGNEVEGKSEVVTTDVSDVVNGIMPSLLRMFTTKDNLVSFDAVGPEDEEESAQETDYVTHVVFKQNEDSFITFHSWMFDALTQKNGIVKAWVDESEVKTEESYKGLIEQEVFKLLEDDELEAVERDEYTETIPRNGEEVETTLHDIRFKRTSKRKLITIEPVPPEEYRISADARHINPSKARFVGQEREAKRSELIEMSFDEKLVMSLPAAGNQTNSQEKTSRRSKEDEQRNSTVDKLEEEVVIRECYLKIDGELRQIFSGEGDTLLSNEPSDRQPFHVLSSMPIPHKHFGTCPSEMVMDIQQVTTTLTRQILDNLYQTNNPRNAVYEQAIGDDTMDGLLSTEIGGNVIFDRPVSESWAPMTVPFTAGATFPMLELWEKAKKDRTGVHSNSEGLSPDALKNIQQGVLRESISMSKEKIEMIARIFAETGFKSLFRHIHELSRKHSDKKEIVKLRGKWVQVDPAGWRDRHNVTVNIGLGIGSKDTNLLHLGQIQQTQAAIEQNGGRNLIVKPKNTYNMAKAIAENSGQDPDLYFSDPGEEMGPPLPQEAQQLQLQAQMLQQKEQDLKQLEQSLNKTMLQHEREMLKIDQNDKHHSDDVMIELEKLRTELTELELKFDTNVPGSVA